MTEQKKVFLARATTQKLVNVGQRGLKTPTPQHTPRRKADSQTPIEAFSIEEPSPAPSRVPTPRRAGVDAADGVSVVDLDVPAAAPEPAAAAAAGGGGGDAAAGKHKVKLHTKAVMRTVSFTPTVGSFALKSASTPRGGSSRSNKVAPAGEMSVKPPKEDRGQRITRRAATRLQAVVRMRLARRQYLKEVEVRKAWLKKFHLPIFIASLIDIVGYTHITTNPEYVHACYACIRALLA